ncbi:Aste57867_22919 [Aphanomyces stellatus]|uniref:Aste57867_22919 protein n=1 Tax=Aphanomyces stellatus TaxID=120398 RepID=A0A485LLA1_9STRA|nr:hypothetical protein As57867_022848 [Aphanomyces stellatus]VFT99569.1 Aste57867_22919 [Aphanomyces stellatus]
MPLANRKSRDSNDRNFNFRREKQPTPVPIGRFEGRWWCLASTVAILLLHSSTRSQVITTIMESPYKIRAQTSSAALRASLSSMWKKVRSTSGTAASVALEHARGRRTSGGGYTSMDGRRNDDIDVDDTGYLLVHDTT